jgi:hypothetical protein
MLLPLKKIIHDSTLAVSCPHCHARPNEGCHSAMGRPQPLHDQRREAAVKAMGEKLPPHGVYSKIERRKA